MKANEAPEKIWMNDEWVRQFDNKDFMGEDSVEYIRKDVFIEKACEKLKKCMYDNLMFQGRLHREEVIETFVEDFKKYINGE